MECVYEYTEGRLCRGVALRLLLLLMAQMDLDVGHGIFNGRHCRLRLDALALCARQPRPLPSPNNAKRLILI